jgi:TetR/AcrR family transcriptional regulator, tetracycline repressor protein
VRSERGTYHAGLSREAVVRGAVDLLQRQGLGGFSLRRLAAELGVDSMALYSHVRNKDDLLGAAVGHAFSSARPAGDGEWWEQVRDTFREHRRVIREQPWVLAVMLSGSLESSEPWAGVEQTVALLRKHLGAAGAARWARFLAAFTNGFLLAEPDLVDSPEASQIEPRFPAVRDALARNARTGDKDFTLGLDLLVTAMRAEAAARPSLRTPPPA